jgi:hypothetical protein
MIQMMETRLIIDTFYKTGSFFMNCMSGWDDQEVQF